MKAPLLPNLAGISMLGLLAVAAGCTGVPVRQSTSEIASAPAAAVDPGFLPPQPIHSAMPEYPWEMKRAGVTGLVRLNCVVDELGHVRDPQVEYASERAFIEPALKAVRQWTFQPARRDGVATAVRVNLPVNFTLQD